MSFDGYRDFGFLDANASHMHRHFMPEVMALAGSVGPGTRVLDVGCGNGYTCGEFLRLGCTVVGLDLSEQGITHARAAYPAGRFELLAADDSVLANLAEAPFDLVVSTEVVEHLYDPRSYPRAVTTRCVRVVVSSARLPTTVTSRISSSPLGANGMRTPIRCGMAATSNSGAGTPFRNCLRSRVLRVSGFAAPDGSRTSG